MKGNWSELITKALKEIDYGVSAHELMLSLSRRGEDITTFKDFILKNSKAMEKGHLDIWELLEQVMGAMNANN